MVGWGDGLGPWKAVRRGDRLYGRGAQDDGYAVFCALTAIEAVQRAGAPHARCLVLIEASEESGSPDLPAYMESFAARIGEPDLVICLDSGCGNYDQLWGTTSLRGIVNGVLTVEVLTEGVHSGAASGIVPSSFRIARQLLSRIEDEQTGAVVAGLPRRDPARAGGGGARGRRACSAPTSPGASRWSRACAMRRTIPWRCSSPARGSPRSPSSAPPGFPRRPTAAMCSGPRPRSSSRCASRPPSTPRARASA